MRLQNESDEGHDYGLDDEQAAEEENAAMEEDDPTPGHINEFVISMLEDMCLQHQENVTLINERMSTLSDQVRVQHENNHPF